jgi:hypothetical protein
MPFCLPCRSLWLAVALAKAGLHFAFRVRIRRNEAVNYGTRKTAVPAVMADGLLACRFI